MSDGPTVFADTRRVTFADPKQGRLIRTEALDPGKPPFNDPSLYEAALRRACRSLSSEGWPRPLLVSAQSVRPMVLAEPRRAIQIVYPDSGLSDAHVEVLNRLPQAFPEIEFMALEVPR